MIKNLNKLSFTQYGQVLDNKLPNRGFPEGPKWSEEMRTVRNRTGHYTCFQDSEIYLDFEEGMAILEVALDDRIKNIDYFYLDKPVCIKRGVYFTITPFKDYCTVRIAYIKGAQSNLVFVPPVKKKLTISPKLKINDIYTLFYQEKEKGFFFKGEQHNPFELTYVDSGQMHSVVNGQDYILKQGEMMLYGPDQWHMQYSDADCYVCFITITFDMECTFSKALLNKIIKVGSDTAALLRQLIKENENADMFSNDLIISYLEEFLLKTLRYLYSGKTDPKLETTVTLKNENQIVDEALKYISKKVYENLSVNSVAKEVNVSSPYLATLFKKHLQISPREYITRIKLAESKILIKEGKFNFTQIADLLKYSSVHHFSRQFKAKFEITPTEYSKALK